MRIIGTNIKKIHVVRNDLKGTVRIGKITNNVQITDVQEIELPTGEKALLFEFKFTTDYQLEKPKGKKLGEIEIMGNIVAFCEEEERKDVMKAWKKKQLEPSLFQSLLNTALEVSQVEALYNAKKVLLPPPIRIPQVRLERPGQGG